jgi:hypothetical protein
MTDQELKDLVASLAVSKMETDRQMQATDRQMQETDRRMQETDRQMQETDRRMKETDQQLKELGKQIGGLGDKFGSFTEGLALPSMTKILHDRFGMDLIFPRARSRNNGRSMEVDVLAGSKTRDHVFVVEVKSHLREDALDQMRRILREFHDFFPGYEGKKLYGILAAVDAPEDVRQKVLQEGIYLARVHDGHFELQVPESFEPRAY